MFGGGGSYPDRRNDKSKDSEGTVIITMVEKYILGLCAKPYTDGSFNHLSHLIFAITVHYHPCFVGEETEAQRGEAISQGHTAGKL